jgi:hypothetical protein
MRVDLGGALLAVTVLLWSCGQDEGDGGTPSEVASSLRGGAGRAPSDTVDLQAMLSPVPEYEGVGRNLFAFGAARSAGGSGAVEPPTVVTPTPPEVVARPTRPSPRQPAPSPAARLDMKYAGFLEKTRPDGMKQKYAIFLDGNEILAGAEGEMVANRFTVVEIGLESVTVASSGTNVTQRIPLQSK